MRHRIPWLVPISLLVVLALAGCAGPPDPMEEFRMQEHLDATIRGANTPWLPDGRP
jgi:hypothetical protein